VLFFQALSEGNVNFSSIFGSLDAILKVLKGAEVTKKFFSLSGRSGAKLSLLILQPQVVLLYQYGRLVE
jgi:hypothetical protein